MWQMTDEQEMEMQGDEGGGFENLRGGIESNEDGDSFDQLLHEYNPKIFSSENSSSDLTQGNVADDLPAPVASDNEANSAADHLYPSNFMQVLLHRLHHF